MSSNNTTSITQTQQPTTYWCSRCQVHYTIEQSYVTPGGQRQHNGWCMDKCDYNRAHLCRDDR